MTTKRCRICEEEKDLSEFPRSKERKDGHSQKCFPCNREIVAAWRKKNPEASREQHRRWRRAHPDEHLVHSYGITQEQFDALHNQQGGLCALCFRAKKLVVDHDHQTGVVRGLLCYHCNSALGRWGDNADGLRKVVEYLERQGDPSIGSRMISSGPSDA